MNASLLDQEWFWMAVFVALIVTALALAALLPPGW